MKYIWFAILLIITSIISAYEVGQISSEYIDEDRDNRLVGVEIFYPEDAPSDSSFTLLVFGHGWLLPYSVYYDFAQEFSSEGYIAAFPTTEGNLFPDHYEFAIDLYFTAESIMQENNNPASPLFDMLNSRKIVMGHSMGGGCSVLAEAEADYFDAVVNFAAAETSPSAIDSAEDVYCPVLVISAESDNIAPPQSHQIPIYENLASDYKAYITISGTNHLNIVNSSILPDLLLNFMEFITIQDQLELIAFEDNLIQLQETGDISFSLYSYHFPYVFGDVDDNGLIEAYDSALVLRYVAGINPGAAAPLPWENWRLKTADVSDNNVIEAYDASLILQCYTGIINSLLLR